MSKNDKIISEFEKLVTSVEYDIDTTKDMKEKKKNIYRLKQFTNALNVLKKYTKTIKSSDDLKDEKGFGPGILSRIDEILKTGKLSEIKTDQSKMNTMKNVENLKEIYGIGEKTAYELVTKYNIKNVDELLKAYYQGKISLNNNVIVGIKYHDTYKQKIPRAEVTKIDKYLHNMAKQTDEKLEVTICGSYRRKKPFSNDIDCMITHPNIVTMSDLKKNDSYLTKFINELREDGFILDSLTSDEVETKYMGFCKYTKKGDVRRIDIRYIPYESYYSALLYFTGSGTFNQTMRQLFKKKGYKLNEYGLYKIRKSKTDGSQKLKRIDLTSEKQAFDILGIDYIPPEKRL